MWSTARGNVKGYMSVVKFGNWEAETAKVKGTQVMGRSDVES